jgi:hypothetical protein
VTVFGVRAEVLRALRGDPVWLRKAEAALRHCDLEELQRVIVEFGKAKGFEIVEVLVE